MKRKAFAIAAALSKQPLVAVSAAPAAPEVSKGPPIQTVTMNGFTILDSEGPTQAPDERRFIVKSPGRDEHEVLVRIDEEAVGYVERMTRRRLPSESSFWTTQAQRLLSDYLWKEGNIPLSRKLIVTDIDRDKLPIAARWQGA